MRVKRSRRLITVQILLGLALAACGLSVAGTGTLVVAADAGASTDATVGPNSEAGGIVDGSSGGLDGADGADGATDGGVDSGPLYDCNGSPVFTCATCAGHPSACGTTCVTQCSSDCPGFRVACFMCFPDASTVIGTCEKENDAGYCMNGDYSPGIACPCAGGDPSTCPGDYQRCFAPDGGDSGPQACHSCGEPDPPGPPKPMCKNPNNKPCDLMGNPTDHLTCH
jgi:hypothetical protein